MYKSDNKDAFMNSLATPGKPGTLKRRMTKSLAESSVYAKTGSLNGVSTLTGYVQNRDGVMFAFSIMIQNQTVPDAVSQNLQDLICMRLASSSLK
jgi:D-alanyl-D-alanine carboxypeptidase/D-alanyl-D-alanine-endopeptidase (penicillin-binding protein 4)